jgi:hypothetical protein
MQRHSAGRALSVVARPLVIVGHLVTLRLPSSVSNGRSSSYLTLNGALVHLGAIAS